MTQRTVTHGSFTLERIYDAAPSRVFAAFASSEAKTRWFKGPPGWSFEHSLDFRVGGREHNIGGPPGGPVHRYEAVIYDIVPDERIITAYEMYIDQARISVSVATLELKPAGAGTRLVLTEQGAFLDGFDNPAVREEGTGALLEQLGAALAAGG
jgi:uncharacterized protein YndB with AHSA1/START domain